MKAVIIALLLVLSLNASSQEYKWGRPTTKGIDEYVETHWLDMEFISAYQKHVGDTLFLDPFISTDDLSKYVSYTRGESGFYEPPDNIVIDNRNHYIDYELGMLSESQRSRYVEANQFVRGVVMHELTHCYIYQIIRTAQYNDTIALHRDYREGLRMIPVDNYYTEFIEEGISEYVAADMGEVIVSNELVRIKKSDLSPANRNSYEIKYRYSQQFVKPVLETLGIKQGITAIIGNAPPTTEEILCPELFYNRLGIYKHGYQISHYGRTQDTL